MDTDYRIEAVAVEEEEEGEGGLRELPVLILMESCGMSDLIQKLSRPATDEKQPGTRAGYFSISQTQDRL